MLRGIVFAIASFGATLSGYAQGSILFANSPATAVYCGFFGGQQLVPRGPAFQAELMFHPDTSIPDWQFEMIAIRVGAATTFNGPVDGVFNGGNRTVATTSPGGVGVFQVRVWESAGGTDYRSAQLSGLPGLHAGKSAIFRADTADITSIPPPTPAPLVGNGLTSFFIVNFGFGGPCIPEPSIYALTLFGAGVLWFLRRRKQIL